MSSDWTVKRLDALPEFSVITWTEGGEPYEAIRHESHWLDTFRDSYGSYYVLKDADPGSIRVVSVPIDALLADETVERVARSLTDDWNPDRDPVLTAMFRDYAQTAASAAVAHVTGEATT